NVAVAFDHVTDESKLLNTQILISRDPIKLNPDLSLNLAAQALLPTDKKSYDEATFRGAGGGIVGLRRSFALLGKEASAGYSVNALINAYKFDRNNVLNANLSHRLRQSADLSVGLNKKLSLSVGG